MTHTEDPSRSPARPESEDTRIRAIQNDIWAHEVYLRARGKMYAGIAAVVAVFATFGFYTAFQFYLNLQDFAIGQTRTTINKRIEDQVDKMIADARPALEVQLKSATDAAIAEAKAAVDTAIAEAKAETDVAVAKATADMNERIASLEQASRDAAAATKRLRDYAIAGQSPSIQPAQNATSALARICDPSSLTPEEIAQIGINQQVHAASGSQASSGRTMYANSFTVGVDNEQMGDRAALEACIQEAVDRVVYKLDEHWFDPSEVVRIDKSNGFRFEVNVWGTTAISATVYLKGDQPPIEFKGAFSTDAGLNAFLIRSA